MQYLGNVIEVGRRVRFQPEGQAAVEGVVVEHYRTNRECFDVVLFDGRRIDGLDLTYRFDGWSLLPRLHSLEMVDSMRRRSAAPVAHAAFQRAVAAVRSHA